jgi:DNA-binding NtrC family response regulator
MKILLLEESRGFRDQLKKALEKKGHEVSLCSDSGTFIDTLEENDYDKMVIDVRSWFRGEVMYKYFNILEKMKAVPMLFHHTPEGFKSLDGRDPVSEDEVLEGPCSIDDIVRLV